MALEEQKILKLMIDKFNDEYVAEHNLEDFNIGPIPSGDEYTYAFQATSSILDNPIVNFRIYFNIGKIPNLTKFTLKAVDDDTIGDIYAFITKGTLTTEAVTDDNKTNPIIDYEGSGQIDPTNKCIDVSTTMQLEEDEW